MEKMKSIVEILELILATFTDSSRHWYGMCQVITVLNARNEFNSKETSIARKYFNENSPLHSINSYWWDIGDYKPRVKWLETQIEVEKNLAKKSKHVDYNWLKLAIIATGIVLMSLLFGCSTNLDRINGNQGKVIYDIFPKINYHDTSYYNYILKDTITNKFSRIHIFPEFHHYEIGDTLPLWDI